MRQDYRTLAVLAVALGRGGWARSSSGHKLQAVRTIGIISGDEFTVTQGALTGLDDHNQRFSA